MVEKMTLSKVVGDLQRSSIKGGHLCLWQAAQALIKGGARMAGLFKSGAMGDPDIVALVRKELVVGADVKRKLRWTRKTIKENSWILLNSTLWLGLESLFFFWYLYLGPTSNKNLG